MNKNLHILIMLNFKEAMKIQICLCILMDVIDLEHFNYIINFIINQNILL